MTRTEPLQPPYHPAEDALLERMQSGTLTLEGLMPWSSNYTFLGHIGGAAEVFPRANVVVDILPNAPEESKEHGWLRVGVSALLANWEWWSQARGQWGAKRQLHELLFAGKPYGGVFIEHTLPAEVSAALTTPDAA